MTALRAAPSLSELDTDALLDVVGDAANLVWRAGSRVFEVDTPGDGLYLVVSGRVRVVARDGAEVAVLGPGSLVGEMSLLLGSPHGHTVEAVEDSELMVVPTERFARIIADHPRAAEAIRAHAAEREAENLRRAQGVTGAAS